MSKVTAYEHYRALRFKALTTKASEIGYAPPAPDAPYGLVMEMGYPAGVASLAAFAGGDASLYFSNGGGVIGGYAHEAVRDAACAAVETAREIAPRMGPAPVLPLPPPSLVRFYLLTEGGLITDQARDSDLASGEHPLSALYFACHSVITQLRTLAEKQDAR